MTVTPFLLHELGFCNNSCVAEFRSKRGVRDVGVRASGDMKLLLAGSSTFAEAKYLSVFSDRRNS